MIYRDIAQLTQAQLALVYKTVPRAWLNPGCTLDQCCRFVNQVLAYKGRDLSQWNSGEQDQIARLLWVNLFYQNLGQEPIRKPLLVSGNGMCLDVTCGDTRLMVLDLANSDLLIPVVSIVNTVDLVIYDNWQLIESNQQLIDQLQFANDAEIFIRIDPDYWFEIGDAGTSGHLHDIGLRIKLMQNYINDQPVNFEFNAAWACAPVDWTKI